MAYYMHAFFTLDNYQAHTSINGLQFVVTKTSVIRPSSALRIKNKVDSV
jgi:hypothetical protein